MVSREKLYTLAEFDEYIARHPNKRIELIHGRMVEKVVSEEHGKIIINIGSELRLWLKRTPGVKGHYSTDPSLRMDDDDFNERRPDLTFRHTDGPVSTSPTMNVMPDFAVEVKSRGNSYDDLRDKARYFIVNGSRLVWLIYPTKRIVEVYGTEGTSELFTENDMLDGGDVLLGFRLRVRDIFDA